MLSSTNALICTEVDIHRAAIFKIYSCIVLILEIGAFRIFKTLRLSSPFFE